MEEVYRAPIKREPEKRYSAQEVADMIGCTRQAIYGRIHKHNLSNRATYHYNGYSEEEVEKIRASIHSLRPYKPMKVNKEMKGVCSFRKEMGLPCKGCTYFSGCKNA